VLNKRANECGNTDNIHALGEDDLAMDGVANNDDCRTLQANIQGDGTFTINLNQQRTLATFGTCVFEASADSALLPRVGNQDIIDLIDTAIDKFSADEETVSAEGTMECNGTKVSFRIAAR
jgi:hypothetical protein